MTARGWSKSRCATPAARALDRPRESGGAHRRSSQRHPRRPGPRRALRGGRYRSDRGSRVWRCDDPENSGAGLCGRCRLRCYFPKVAERANLPKWSVCALDDCGSIKVLSWETSSKHTPTNGVEDNHRMSFTVFLGNLPAWVTADDIKGWLSAENLVADAIKVIRNPETQESKGFRSSSTRRMQKK